MPGRLEEKIALVTGAASGIGRATALTFAREGAKLIVADVDEDGGQQTAHIITENGGDAAFVRVDVTSATDVEAMLHKTVEVYGRLDCAHPVCGAARSGEAGCRIGLGPVGRPVRRWTLRYRCSFSCRSRRLCE